MKAHLYTVFSKWSDDKLITEYEKKSEYQPIAMEAMKQVMRERGLLEKAEEIDRKWLGAETIRQNSGIKHKIKTGNRERHWFVTTWFVLMLAMNAFVAWFNLYYFDFLEQTFSDNSSRKIIVLLVLLPFLNLFFVFGLFKYKRWGFYGFLFTAIVSFVMNIAMNGFNLSAMIGFASFTLLYAILQITKNGVSTWEYME